MPSPPKKDSISIGVLAEFYHWRYDYRLVCVCVCVLRVETGERETEKKGRRETIRPALKRMTAKSPSCTVIGLTSATAFKPIRKVKAG